jgi:hypothetical protein
MLHRFFILVSILAIAAAVNMMAGQFIGIAYKSIGPIQYVLRLYVIGLCALVILNELEWFRLTTESKILHWWIPRGVLYAFIGVLGLEENNTTVADKNVDATGRDAALSYIKAVAWLMVACGVLYVVMGAFCLQIVCNRLREDYARRVERAKEVQRTTDTYGSRVV